MIQGAGARLYTSVPVILETFTFLDRNASRDVAISWKESLEDLELLQVLPCASEDLARAWPYFKKKDLHKLSAVDASSFALMKKQQIRTAFAFDHHFATVGFRMVG